MANEEDDDYHAVASDQQLKPPSSCCHDDQVKELLWCNGPVVMQAKRSHKKSEDHHHHSEDMTRAVVAGGFQFSHHDPSLQPQHQQNNDNANNNLFIQEDEMVTWLLSDFCSDLPLPSASTSPIAPAPSAFVSHPARPPLAVRPPRRFETFGHFSRLNRLRTTTAVEGTITYSSDTPMVARVSEGAAGHDVARFGAESTSAGVRDAAKCDLTVTSSSGASSASAEPIPPVKSPKAAPPLPSIRRTTVNVPEERRRIASRGKRHPNGEYVELVHKEGKKHVLGGSQSTKRSRAAEVHNLSERRRRHRINEKMRHLQELIPHCNKADKASMLDEAIEYLKSLQMQVHMISMGCGMMPMMYHYPGLQQYMLHMGMGLGIGMGMEMGMNRRPMVQFPHVFTGSRGVGPPMCPRFRFPAFRMPPPIPLPNNQPNTVFSSVSPHNSIHPRMPGFMDPYQQFLGLRHMHSPLHRADTSSSGLATTSKAGETHWKRHKVIRVFPRNQKGFAGDKDLNITGG